MILNKAYTLENRLLLQIAAGNEQAFADLFLQYKDKVYAIGLKMTESSTVAEDIVQDVFLRIWLKREEMKEINSFRSYLYTATRNHVFNALKRAALREKLRKDWEGGVDLAGSFADTGIAEKEYNQFLDQAVNNLPDRQRHIYQLVTTEGLKREEVARLLGISPETVKHHLAHARRTVRDFLIRRLLGEGALLVYLILTNITDAK